jgi:hypothetical protein
MTVREKCDEKMDEVQPVVLTFSLPPFAKCAKDGAPGCMAFKL